MGIALTIAFLINFFIEPSVEELFLQKKYASSFSYMYESREMAFLLALVLVVEKGKRQYSLEFEHFVVLRK